MTLPPSQLPIVVEYERPEQIMKDIPALARVKELSSYEASYPDLAMKKGLLLATPQLEGTLDKKLFTPAGYKPQIYNESVHNGGSMQ